jgi:hypothetical protein
MTAPGSKKLHHWPRDLGNLGRPGRVVDGRPRPTANPSCAPFRHDRAACELGRTAPRVTLFTIP